MFTIHEHLRPRPAHLAVAAVLFPSSSPQPRPAGAPGCASPPVSELRPRRAAPCRNLCAIPSLCPHRTATAVAPTLPVASTALPTRTAAPTRAVGVLGGGSGPTHTAPHDSFLDRVHIIRRHFSALVDPAALSPQPRPATVEEPASGRRRRPSLMVPLSIQIQVIPFLFSLCLLKRMSHFSSDGFRFH
jgi:hypothetical protein